MTHFIVCNKMIALVSRDKSRMGVRTGDFSCKGVPISGPYLL